MPFSIRWNGLGFATLKMTIVKMEVAKPIWKWDSFVVVNNLDLLKKR